MSPEPAVFTLAAPDPVSGAVPNKWDSLDMAAILASLKATGVSAPEDKVPELTALVAEAKADGHDLYIVSTDQSFAPNTVFRDIAYQLQESTGGTVLVFGGNGLGTASSDYTRVELEDAVSEMSKGAGTAQAARDIYAKANDPNADWTFVTIALIVVVVVGAVLARLAMLRRSPATETVNSESAVDTPPAGTPATTPS